MGAEVTALGAAGADIVGTGSAEGTGVDGVDGVDALGVTPVVPVAAVVEVEDPIVVTCGVAPCRIQASHNKNNDTIKTIKRIVRRVSIASFFKGLFHRKAQGQDPNQTPPPDGNDRAALPQVDFHETTRAVRALPKRTQNNSENIYTAGRSLPADSLDTAKSAYATPRPWPPPQIHAYNYANLGVLTSRIWCVQRSTSLAKSSRTSDRVAALKNSFAFALMTTAQGCEALCARKKVLAHRLIWLRSTALFTNFLGNTNPRKIG